jgi:hypothetical protein
MWDVFKKQEKCFITLDQAGQSMKRKFTNDNETYFDVEGSCQIKVSNNCNSSTGSVKGGISIGVSAFPGGVISKQEAERLAQHLLHLVNSAKE